MSIKQVDQIDDTQYLEGTVSLSGSDVTVSLIPLSTLNYDVMLRDINITVSSTATAGYTILSAGVWLDISTYAYPLSSDVLNTTGGQFSSSHNISGINTILPANANLYAFIVFNTALSGNVKYKVSFDVIR